MSYKYKAILFSTDGEFVTDYKGQTKEEVWELVNNGGSRWFFYPLVFCCTDKTIVETPHGFEEFKNKRITTVKKYITENCDEICGRLGIPSEG